jgi:hypothetical protein
MDDKQIDAEEGKQERYKQERYLRLADVSGWVLLLGLIIELVDAAFSGKAFSEIIWILVPMFLSLLGWQANSNLPVGRRDRATR